MASRSQNERKFKYWEELPDGGRRYIREFAGRAGGRARYIKEVDAAGPLVAVHEKFPVDLGHKRQ
jgi:hypothetical protein